MVAPGEEGGQCQCCGEREELGFHELIREFM
jgi:hypothetical protein